MVLSSFNWADWLIVGILSLSALISLIRGFVREALSLASWALAFFVAITFHAPMVALLEPMVEKVYVRDLLAYVSLFLGTLLVGSLLTWLFGELVRRTGLSGTDRLLGSIFGVARGFIVVLAIVVLAPSMLNGVEEDQWWQESLLIPHFQVMTDWSEKTFSELSSWVSASWHKHRDAV